MPSNHLILCHALLLLPSVFPSIRVFSSESVLRIRWSKYWSFSFSISPSNEHPGLISFRMDGLVGSPCSPRDSQESSPTPQFKSINSSALSFLYVLNSHIRTWLLEKPYLWLDGTFVGKVTSLLLNMLSRLVTAFLPRSKRLLIPWLQSLSVVIFTSDGLQGIQANNEALPVFKGWTSTWTQNWASGYTGLRASLPMPWAWDYAATALLTGKTDIWGKRGQEHCLPTTRLVGSSEGHSY